MNDGARRSISAATQLAAIVRWYADAVHGRLEGPGCRPFYCDPARVGAFAVEPETLARGDDAAVFQTIVTLAMYQSRRDVDVMMIQRTMRASAAREITTPYRLQVASCSGADADGGRGGVCWVPRAAHRRRGE